MERNNGSAEIWTITRVSKAGVSLAPVSHGEWGENTALYSATRLAPAPAGTVNG